MMGRRVASFGIVQGPYCLLSDRDSRLGPSQQFRIEDTGRRLPPEVEALANFTDGPGACPAEGGFLSWWRYQGP